MKSQSGRSMQSIGGFGVTLDAYNCANVIINDNTVQYKIQVPYQVKLNKKDFNTPNLTRLCCKSVRFFMTEAQWAANGYELAYYAAVRDARGYWDNNSHQSQVVGVIEYEQDVTTAEGKLYVFSLSDRQVYNFTNIGDKMDVSICRYNDSQQLQTLQIGSITKMQAIYQIYKPDDMEDEDF